MSLLRWRIQIDCRGAIVEPHHSRWGESANRADSHRNARSRPLSGGVDERGWWGAPVPPVDGELASSISLRWPQQLISVFVAPCAPKQRHDRGTRERNRVGEAARAAQGETMDRGVDAYEPIHHNPPLDLRNPRWSAPP